MIKFYPIRERTKGMARHKKLQNRSPQKDCPKTWRTIWNRRSTRTCHLSAKTWKIHNVFYATLLCLYIENEIYGNNYPQPPAELLEGEEVYEVETILKHRKRGRGYQYYIKWKGYPVTEATWENKSAFSEDGDMVEQYIRHQLWHHHPWNNMPSMQLSRLMPNLKAKGSRIWLNERTHGHRV